MSTRPLHPERASEGVRAKLTFLRKTAAKPINYPSVAGGEAERNTGPSDAHEVFVCNARSSGKSFSLDRQGFMLLTQPTEVSDFYDDEQVESIFKREVASTLQHLTDARQVVVFDVTRRSDDLALMKERKTRDPSRTVHNDYTPRSARRRIEDLLPEQAAEALARRFAIVNLWRSMAGPVLRAPIALCDARSLDDDDLIATERRARDRVGETFRVAFNPGQQWHYFPAMSADEVLLIKTFDSATDGRARFAPHAAFDPPAGDASAPPRESIEARAFVLY